MELTKDIKEKWRGWFNLARRLQAEGCKQKGLAIAKFYVVLNSEGCPVFWTEPKVTLLEPKKQADEIQLKALVEIFGDRVIELLTESVN